MYSCITLYVQEEQTSRSGISIPKLQNESNFARKLVQVKMIQSFHKYAQFTIL